MVRRQTRVTCQVSGTPPPPRPVPGGLLMTPGAELLWPSPEGRKKGEREGPCEGGSCRGVQEQVSNTDVLDLAWRVAAPDSGVEAQALHSPLCSFVQSALKSLFDCLHGYFTLVFNIRKKLTLVFSLFLFLFCFFF